MALFFLDLKRSKISFIIWTAVLTFMLAVCVLIYPIFVEQMAGMSDMFAGMGLEGEALSFTSFPDYFAMECGEVLGLGGAIFAAILGGSALAKEQKDRTAEFLLTHPISRKKVVAQKLLFVGVQIVTLNAVVAAVSAGCIAIIGEALSVRAFLLLFAAYLLLQLELAAIVFALSTLMKGGIGIGIGAVFLFYFLNIIASLADSLAFLKYLTPFSFAEGANILADNALAYNYLGVGLAVTALCVVASFWRFAKKDIT